MTTLSRAGGAMPEKRIAVPAKASARDTRLDVLRAIALIMIFVNHVPGNVFEMFTSKNFGFSDASEAFVLISGISVALAYGRRFNSGDRWEASQKVTRRAMTLYFVHLALTVATLVLFIGGAFLFATPALMEQINIAPLLDNLQAGIPAVILLGHQLGYNNILSLYAVLLMITPLILWMEARSPIALLAVSFLIWLGVGILQIAPRNMLDSGIWFFNPLSWQFIYVIGIVAMQHVRRGGKILRHPLLIAVAGAYALLSLLWVMLSWWHIDVSLGLPAVLTGFNKTYLSAPRLLHVLSITYLIIAIRPVSSVLRLSPDNPLTVVGRHGLSIFAAGTVLAMGGQVLTQVYDQAPLLSAFYVAAGTLALFAIAFYLEAEKARARQKGAKVDRPAEGAFVVGR